MGLSGLCQDTQKVRRKGTYSISPDANIYRIYMRDGYDVVLVNTKAK